jgi:hypothetical protein
LSNRRPSRKNREKISADTPVISKQLCFLLLGVVVLFFSLVRFHLRDIPLERDEGEYAYAGQLLLQGIPPYKLAYNMKLPGTYAAYALIMAILGQTPAAIHFGLILVNAASVVLVFFLGRKLFGPVAGLTAASSFALLSCSESVLGLAGHATHFVVPAAVAGILLLLKALESSQVRDYFWSGLLLGSAFVLKQPGLFFCLFGGLYLIVHEWQGTRNWRNLGVRVAVYSAGSALPFALTCLVLYCWGSFDKMWFWTFSYGQQYASIVTLSRGLQIFLDETESVVGPCLPIWILAAGGVVALGWDARGRKHSIFMIGFLLFSFLAVCPGLYFRPHYYILLLPAVGLFVGLAVSWATDELRRRARNPFVRAIPAFVLLGAFALSLENQYEVLFEMDPLAVCHKYYGANPFPEAIPIADYINRHTTPDAKIAVIGSEPEIYFYSKRHSATGYIYTYPLTEAQKYAFDMQKDMAREIEQAQPDFMVFVKINASWLSKPESNTFILDWFRQYASANYQIVGIADELGPETRYVWGDEAKIYHEQSQFALEIFQRKNR